MTRTFMPKPTAAGRSVSSTEFARRFGHWSLAAQSEPVKVTNPKTGAVLGYFVSAAEFENYVRVSKQLPKARNAWEMDEQLSDALDKPLPRRRPKLDKLMQD